MAGPSSTAKRRPPREPRAVRPHPKDEAEIRAGIEEVERGEGITLTQEEVDRWAETGELPEHVEKWAEQLDKSSSPPGS